MSPEKDKLLVEKFPNTFARRSCPTGGKNASCMGRGFSCDDGWFDLIYEAATVIEAELLKMNARNRYEYAVEQVKEKFGTIRIYIHRENDVINEAISKAYAKSAVTCEKCGEPGKTMSGSWVQTLCHNCNSARVADWVKGIILNNVEIGEDGKPIIKNQEELDKRLLKHLTVGFSEFKFPT